MNQDPLVRGIQVGKTAAPSAVPTRPDALGGPAFRALLDQLTEQTRQLKADGDKLSAPAELAGVVDRARASIDDALSLSDQLLEAYRAHQSQDETTKEQAS